MAESLESILADEEKFRVVTMKTFKEDDLDSSGFVDRSELTKLMGKVAVALHTSPPTAAEIEETFKANDTNSDGRMSYDEYQRFARTLLTKVYQNQRKSSHREPGPIPHVATKSPELEVLPQASSPHIKTGLGMKSNPISKPQPLPEVLQEVTPLKQVVQPPEEPRKKSPRSKPSPVKSTTPRLKSKTEAIAERMRKFEDYMNRWRLAEAMQLIFVEIETKRIEPAQVYKYTAMRLRQLGKDPDFLQGVRIK